jgi:hypothetical protein
MKTITILIISSFLISCVSKSQHEKVLKENQQLKSKLLTRSINFDKQVDKLVKQKLEEFKKLSSIEDKLYYIKYAITIRDCLKSDIRRLSNPIYKFSTLQISFADQEDAIHHDYNEWFKEELYRMFSEMLNYEWMKGEKYDLDMEIYEDPEWKNL